MLARGRCGSRRHHCQCATRSGGRPAEDGQPSHDPPHAVLRSIPVRYSKARTANAPEYLALKAQFGPDAPTCGQAAGRLQVRQGSATRKAHPRRQIVVSCISPKVAHHLCFNRVPSRQRHCDMAIQAARTLNGRIDGLWVVGGADQCDTFRPRVGMSMLPGSAERACRSVTGRGGAGRRCADAAIGRPRNHRQPRPSRSARCRSGSVWLAHPMPPRHGRTTPTTGAAQAEARGTGPDRARVTIVSGAAPRRRVVVPRWTGTARGSGRHAPLRRFQTG